MNRKVARLLAILVLTGVTRAQEAPAARAPAREDLRALFEPIRAKHDVPALAGAIVAGSDIVAIGAVGVRARGSAETVTIDDQWCLCSCTKSMTATLIARFVERGKLDWSTTIGAVFTDLRSNMRPEWRDVTLEMLLQMRAGVPAGFPDDPTLASKLWAQKGTPVQERRLVVEGVLGKARAASPDTPWIYSNESIVIAGAMLETVLGKPWEKLIDAEIFKPLHMESAGFGAPGKREVISQPRGHDPNPIEPGPLADNPLAYAPAARVHCSLPDWAKFAAAHLRGENGTDSILKAATFRKLHACPEGIEYAMGWRRMRQFWTGGDAYYHEGENQGWTCMIWIVPAKDCAFLAATNLTAVGDDQGKARTACNDAVLAMLRKRKLIE